MIAVMSNFNRRVVGLVHRDSKVAAGRNGARATFWTAWVVVDGRRTGPSLGTRHKSEASARKAVREFWKWFDATLGHQTPPTHYAVDSFKYKHPRVCALPFKPAP